MDAHRAERLAALREAVLSADLSLQMAETVVEANRDLELEALEALILRYRTHGEDLQKTMNLVSTFNQVAAEEMEAFREEAIDIVHEFFRELAEKEGWEYAPPPNPYRRPTPPDDDT